MKRRKRVGPQLLHEQARSEVGEGATQTLVTTSHHGPTGNMHNKRDETPQSVALSIYRWRLEGKTWAEIQDEFNVTAVTAKAILENHGLNHSPNGTNRKVTEKWTRPCLKCRKEEERSKGLFLCKACRQENRDRYGAADEMYAGYESTPVKRSPKQ